MGKSKSKWWKHKQRSGRAGVDSTVGDGRTDDYVDTSYGEVQRHLALMESRQPSITAATGATSTVLPNGYVPSSNSTAALSTKHDKKGKGTTQYGWWNCGHTGIKEIAKVRDATIHIGAVHSLQSVHAIDLLVQCTTDAKPWTARDEATIPDSYAQLRQYLRGGPKDIIILPWPDGGLPPVQPEFWGALEEALPKGKVVFACIGGHGRSGTAAAALLIQHFKYTAAKAMREIRGCHCDDAIETRSQENYLTYFARWLADKEGWRAKLDAEEAEEAKAAPPRKASPGWVATSKVSPVSAEFDKYFPPIRTGAAPDVAERERQARDASLRRAVETASANADTSGEKVPAWELDNGEWCEIEMCANCGERTSRGEPCPSCPSTLPLDAK